MPRLSVSVVLLLIGSLGCAAKSYDVGPARAERLTIAQARAGVEVPPNSAYEELRMYPNAGAETAEAARAAVARRGVDAVIGPLPFASENVITGRRPGPKYRVVPTILRWPNQDRLLAGESAGDQELKLRVAVRDAIGSETLDERVISARGRFPTDDPAKIRRALAALFDAWSAAVFADR